MAEYNTPCLQLIKQKYLGPSKEMLKTFSEWWENNEEEITKKREKSEYFSVGAWEDKVNYVFEGFTLFLKKLEFSYIFHRNFLLLS